MPKKKNFVALKIGGVNHLTSSFWFLFSKILEYILYSFPIKPNLLISHIGSISWILFYVFISPRYKRQHAPSLNIASPHRKLHFSYWFTYLRLFSAILPFCFASVCTTKNCKFWIKMSFFALLINLQL